MATASDLDRMELCPGSEVLPHTGEITAYADSGNERHGFLGDVGDVGREEALARAPEDMRAIYAATDLDALGVEPGAFLAEVALAWCWSRDSARVLGRNLGRRYGELSPTEIAGTLDAVAERGPRHGVVGDWKTGWRPVRPVRRNNQIRFAAVAAARAYDWDTVDAFVCYDRGNGPTFDKVTWNAIELDAIADDLRAVIWAARRATPGQLIVGDHCRYCKAFRHCPAQRASLQLLADSTLEIGPEIPPEAVGAVWERLEMATLALKKIRAAIEDYAAQQPIPLADGKVLRHWPIKGRPQWDHAAAEQYLTQRFGPEVAAKAMLRTTDLSKIKTALLPVARESGEKITHLMTETDRALSRIGALSRPSSSRFEARVPKEEAKQIEQEPEPQALTLEPESF